jgi:hypothetical protein
MVNIFIIAFLSVRALAVTTSITRIHLKSKVILKKNDRGEGLAMISLRQLVAGWVR